MKKEKIFKGYNKFNIPEKDIPEYENNPEKFAKKFKKCSILKIIPINYESNTGPRKIN